MRESTECRYGMHKLCDRKQVLNDYCECDCHNKTS